MDKKDMSLLPTLTQPKVNTLDDIAGMRNLKKVLCSLIILPRTQPQLYKNHKIANSILLYGPPGTGKTKLVHAVAAKANAELHCVCASNLLSCYVGETERNIKAVFDNVNQSQHLAIIFIDELDGFCMKRTMNENDYSRRIKTELMCQLSNTDGCTHVIIIGATNRPWDLDSAILRRFSRRYYVPLPNKDERGELLRLFTKDIDIIEGSDLSDLVQHAIEIPITELQDTAVWVKEDGCYKPLIFENNYSESLDNENTEICDISELDHGSVKARPLHVRDFAVAVNSFVKSISKEEIATFEEFEHK